MPRRESLPDVHERNYLGGGCCFLIGTLLYVLGFTVPFWPTQHDGDTGDSNADPSTRADSPTVARNLSTALSSTVGRKNNGSRGLEHVDEIFHSRWMFINFVLRSVTIATMTLTALFAVYLFVGLNETHCPRFMRYSGIFCGVLALLSEGLLWASGQSDARRHGFQMLASAFCTVGALLCTAGGLMFCHVYPLNARLLLHAGPSSSSCGPGDGWAHGMCCPHDDGGGGSHHRHQQHHHHRTDAGPVRGDAGGGGQVQGRQPCGEGRPLLSVQ